ncbi:MAG TPA: hypothetical protein PLV68_16260, partial [Ilumatobacteraceae bacterium]|nr:hypothetical protein [Ilumatobacteraceae bacterium]
DDNNLEHDQHSASPTTSDRTAWDVIEEACTQRLTGELALTTAAGGTTRVYVNAGLIYFAEHDGAPSLAEQLVIAGALDDQQLQRGMVRLNGTEHLGRLFERDASIDRDSVELAVELITEDTLTDIAEQAVITFRSTIYRHHPSGINRWFASVPTVASPLAEAAPAEVVSATAKPALTLVRPVLEPAATLDTAAPDALTDLSDVDESAVIQDVSTAVSVETVESAVTAPDSPAPDRPASDTSAVERAEGIDDATTDEPVSTGLAAATVEPQPVEAHRAGA